MEWQQLLRSAKVRIVKAAQTAAASDIESDEVDMQGYDGVIFLTSIGTANSGNFIKVQQDTVTGMATAADLEGTKVLPTVNGQGVGVEIYKPLERFVRLYVVRGASSTCGEIWALQYRGRLSPPDNAEVGVMLSECHISPAEGTA